MSVKDRINKYLNEEKGGNDIQKKIIAFLKDTPSPADADIHEFSNKEGIDTHKFEAFIYDILGSFLGAGMAKEKGIEEKDVDPKELKMGVKVEMEHTSNPLIATRIALDHLAEIKDYYTRLAKMEKDAGVED